MGKRVKAIIAASLVIGSSLLFLLLPVVPILPVSNGMKMGIVVAINVVSWVIFFIGSAMGGKEIWHKLKKCIEK